MKRSSFGQSRSSFSPLAGLFLACLALISFAASRGSFAQQATAESPAESSQQNEHGTGVVPPGVKLVPAMPAQASARPFHFPTPAMRTLPNGLRIFVISDHEQQAIAAQLVILSAGATRDPAGMPGTAEMTANLLTQGTKTRSALDIAQAIDFVGGSLSATAGKDSTTVTLSVVKKDLNTGMDLMSDVVLHPAFQTEELDRQRQQLLSNLQVQYSDPDYLASAVFSRVVYGASPYGWPEEGTPQTVGMLNREQISEFHDATYAPNASILAFAGDVTPAEAFSIAERYFGGWPKIAVSDAEHMAPSAPTPGMHVWLVDKPDAVQTQIRVGKLGIRRADPNYIPLLVTNRIFGGGYNSRLNTEVRVKKGLTYGAYSSFTPHRYAGVFSVGTFTRTQATVDATKLVVNLLDRMSTGDITEEELNFARDYLAGVYPIQSETAEQVAGRVVTAAAFDLPADYNSSYPDRIRAVTAQQVKEMAQRYLETSGLNIVLAGNVAAFRDALKKAFPDATFDEIAYDRIDLLSANLRKGKSVSAAPR